MDIIELARQLGKAIQEDERFIEYHRARRLNDADEALQNLIGEFNLVRQNLAMQHDLPEAEQNKDKIAELTKKMQSVYNEIMTNENMAQFTMAKAEMDKMMSGVNTILTYALEGEDPMTCPSEQPQSSCSGNCGSCGGCH